MAVKKKYAIGHHCRSDYGRFAIRADDFHGVTASVGMAYRMSLAKGSRRSTIRIGGYGGGGNGATPIKIGTYFGQLMGERLPAGAAS
jgi:hypothetical protein